MPQNGITDRKQEEKEAFELLSSIKPEYISRYLNRNRESVSNRHKSLFTNEEELKNWFNIFSDRIRSYLLKGVAQSTDRLSDMAHTMNETVETLARAIFTIFSFSSFIAADSPSRFFSKLSE